MTGRIQGITTLVASIILLIATSPFETLAVSFLHGFPPGFLVSVTDLIATLLVVFLAALKTHNAAAFTGTISGLVLSQRMPATAHTEPVLSLRMIVSRADQTTDASRP